MAGTKDGARRAADKNMAKYGADYYERIGSLGGSAKNPNKGFGAPHRRHLAVAAGAKGGALSRRGPSKK